MSKLILVAFRKGVFSKGRICSPLGANSFLLEQTPFPNGLGMQERKWQVTIVVSLVHK